MTIFVWATVTREDVSLPFQIIVFPAISPIAVFHPETAHGKLKAEMIPIDPIGFHYSTMLWFGLSLASVLPPIVLDMPHAMSQISMYS